MPCSCRIITQATDKDGNSILKDKKVTGFTNNEEDAIHLDKVPLFVRGLYERIRWKI
jgi:hypothetical protein